MYIPFATFPHLGDLCMSSSHLSWYYVFIDFDIVHITVKLFHSSEINILAAIPYQYLEFANIPSSCTDAPMVQGISIHHVYHFTILHIVSSSFSFDIGLSSFAHWLLITFHWLFFSSKCYYCTRLKAHHNRAELYASFIHCLSFHTV